MKFLLVVISFGMLMACTHSGDSGSTSQTPKDAIQAARATSSIVDLAVIDTAACAIAYGKVQCWGDVQNIKPSNLPKLINPRKIAISIEGLCVLDDEGVKCAGDGFEGIPPLRNPKQIAVSYSRVCVLSDDGVGCWGSDTSPDTTPMPSLSHPTEIAAADDHFCAIDGSDVKCWGFEQRDDNNMTGLKHPRLLAVSKFNSCVIDDDGLKCKAANGIDAELFSTVVAPDKVGIDTEAPCVLAQGKVTCWRIAYTPTSYIRYHQVFTMFAEVTFPLVLMSRSERLTCVADATTVHCEGANDEHQCDVPDLNPPPPPVLPKPVPGEIGDMYTAVGQGQCLKSWNWKSSLHMVCSTQGQFSFFDLENATDPLLFAARLRNSDGSSVEYRHTEFEYQLNGLVLVRMRSDRGDALSVSVSLQDPNAKPNFGFAVVNGNSGDCVALVSGDQLTCFNAWKSQDSQSDEMQSHFSLFEFPKGILVTVGTCDLKSASSDSTFFEVTSDSCMIGSETYSQGNSISFDLGDTRNYPTLTTPVQR